MQKKLHVVFETGDQGGASGVALVTELVLHPDGTVTGTAVLEADGGISVALAATGTHDVERLAARAS
jgi:hypothetical protein